MKIINLLILFLLSAEGLLSQDAASTPELATNPNAAVITSDFCQLDMTKKQGVFTTNVVVVAKDFKMTADEMTIFFAAGTSQKIDHLVATGNVVIQQSDETAKANQAVYYDDEGKMVLTGNPEVLQKSGNHITGTSITFYHGSKRMEVEGRSRMVIFKDMGTNSSTTPPAN